MQGCHQRDRTPRAGMEGAVACGSLSRKGFAQAHPSVKMFLVPGFILSSRNA